MLFSNKLNEYCNNEYVPKPYELCCSIIDNIIKNLYSFSFTQIWENTSRNLVNIYGILSDIRLITNTELLVLKTKLLDETINIEKLEINKDILPNTIYTMFSLYFNKIDYYRIIKVQNLSKQGFFLNKGIDLDYTQFFESEPYVNKFYIDLLDSTGGWSIMYEINKLNEEDLLNLLYQLNDKMLEYDLPRETLYIVGGYVCLINKDKQATCDIDYYCKHEIINVKQLAYDIGLQNNAIGWLSDLYSLSKRGYCASLDDLLSIENSFYEYMSLSKLNLFVQSDKCILFTKLNAGRDKDILDVSAIIKRLNITSKEQLNNYIHEYISLPSAKIDIINTSINKLNIN